MFSLVFNFMAKKNKKNNYGKNNNFTYHLTKIDNNYEDIDEIYNNAENLFNTHIEKLLNSQNNKITQEFIEKCNILKNRIIENTKKKYNNNLSNNALETINNKLNNKIKLFEELKNLDKNKTVFDENTLENLIFNNFYKLVNDCMNKYNIIDDNFILQLKKQKNSLLNNFRNSYIYTNFEDYYKNNNYSKDFLNNYYEILKKLILN